MNSRHKLYVTKRNGELVPVSFDAITQRLYDLCELEPKLDTIVCPFDITSAILYKIKNGITTSDIDEFTADHCSIQTSHPDFLTLAARLIINNHHKNILCAVGSLEFSDIVETLHNNKDIQGLPSSIVNEEFYQFVKENSVVLNAMIVRERDYLFDYFGYRTLQKSYFLKVYNNDTYTLVEHAQHLFLRVAIACHLYSDEPLETRMNLIKETYDSLSNKEYTHATPTLFNAGCIRQQLFSCFIFPFHDSVDGIFGGTKDCANISKYAGGIGLAWSDIRATGSYVRGTNGRSDGLKPMLELLNATCRYINQGYRRNGSFAGYLEPWHFDIFDFLDAKNPQLGTARDLFYGLWIPDLFMERVKNDDDWYLMCPNECPRLTETYGSEFEDLYNSYVSKGMYRKKIKAKKVMEEIIKSQIQTGTPYMCYKDHVNRKSNHKNIGVIKSSNLCVAPETRILTKEGYYPIIDLVDKTVEVWNGTEWSETTVRQTGINQKLIKVTLSNGSVISCTNYHKFITETGSRPADKSVEQIIEAKDLKAGTKLIKFDLPKLHTYPVILIPQEQITVVSIEDEDRYSDTYCFTESKKNRGIFEGVLLGNCSEINQYHSTEKYACCCLSSIILPTYVKVDTETGIVSFDYTRLVKVARLITRNLNNMIEFNYYPVEQTRKSNMSERPLGIGVQGLQDVFFKFKVPFDSPEAKDLNKRIFEAIYYGCISESNELAKKYGPYETFKGSPMSEGILQFDMWENYTPTDNYDWNNLKKSIVEYGVRNSLLTALMPTASTSNIAGSTECFEPISSNFYKRRISAGEFIMFNKYLVEDLVKLNLWNNKMVDKLIANNGSVQTITEIPVNIRNVYKTAYEYSQKELLNMCADRSVYVDQSSSMNLFFSDISFEKLYSAHLYGYKLGLKTGSYYIRAKAASSAEKIKLNSNKLASGQLPIVQTDLPISKQEHESQIVYASSYPLFHPPSPIAKEQFSLSLFPLGHGEETEKVCDSCSG